MRIHSYHDSHHSEVDFFTTNKERTWKKFSDLLYFGVELEVECGIDSYRHDVADEIDSVHSKFRSEKYVTLEHDGSLRNGFEIISQPMTLEYHAKFPWRKLFKKLRSLGVRSHDTDTCGLHVHVNKSALSERQQERYAFFMYVQKQLVKDVSRRSHNRYSTGKYFDITKVNKQVKNDNHREERYCMMNFKNEHTIEFRQGKGTLNYRSFMAVIELCHAAIRYTGIERIDILAGNKSRSLQRFLSFIGCSNNKEYYKNLIAHLNKKGYGVPIDVKNWRKSV